MRFERTAIDGVRIIYPDVHEDERGFLLEEYSAARFHEAGIDTRFVQGNHSRSKKGVVRGLHYQLPPFAQAKLVRVIRGAAYDVTVDIRKGSSTFGRWVAETLSATNRKMMYMPEGVAHGFLALEEGTELLYKASDVYAPEHQRGIVWNDPKIGIAWPNTGSAPMVSERDRILPPLDRAELP